MVNWDQWESKKITEPKPSTQKILALKSTSLKTLLKELIKDVNDLSLHLFFANWQHKQISSLKEIMPNNTLLCVMDFAENYSLNTRMDEKVPTGAMTKLVYIQMFVISTEVQARQLQKKQYIYQMTSIIIPTCWISVFESTVDVLLRPTFMVTTSLILCFTRISFL